jgi:hypothetical protein
MRDVRKSIIVAASVLFAAMSGSLVIPRQAHADDEEGTKICYYQTTTITQHGSDGTIIWQTSKTVLLYCITTP